MSSGRPGTQAEDFHPEEGTKVTAETLNMMFPKFEGEIVIHTKMMIDPNAKTRRGGGKHLGIRRGEILEVIEFTSKDEMLCRDPKGKCKCAWPTSRERSEGC